MSILVPSSTKSIITHIFVIAKFNGKKDLVLRVLFMIWSFSAKKYLLKVSNWSTNVRPENCSIEDSRTTSMASLWCFFIVEYERVSQILLIADFEQENVCWVHTENKSSSEEEIRYIMRYFVIFSVWTKFIRK